MKEYGELWTRLMTCIKKCDVIANEINEELKSIKIKKFGLFTNGFRLYDLESKKDDIKRLWS